MEIIQIIKVISLLIMGISCIQIIYAGFKYASSCCGYHIENTKKMIIYSGMGLMSSMLTLILLKITVKYQKQIIYFFETYSYKIHTYIFCISLAWTVVNIIFVCYYMTRYTVIRPCEPKAIEENKMKIISSGMLLAISTILLIIVKKIWF